MQGSNFNSVLVVPSVCSHRVDRRRECSLGFAGRLLPVTVAEDTQLVTLPHSLRSAGIVKMLPFTGTEVCTVSCVFIHS